MNKNLVTAVVKILLYLPFIALIFLIGLYPLQFFLSEGRVGILQMKSEALLGNQFWKTFFYAHIVFGGIALLIGWIQFNRWFRNSFKSMHRWIGKIYVGSIFVSALGVGVIGFFAEGGPIAFFGFMVGNLIWLYATTKGYLSIRRGLVLQHEKWMMYSYAVCLGAVTLRIWLPLLSSYTNNFILSYQIVAWMAWAPNLVLTYFLIRRKELKLAWTKVSL